LGYVATSGAKFDVIFCSVTPISYKGDEIFALSRYSFPDLKRERLTDDTRNDQNVRLLQCVSLISIPYRWLSHI